MQINIIKYSYLCTYKDAKEEYVPRYPTYAYKLCSEQPQAAASNKHRAMRLDQQTKQRGNPTIKP